MTKGQRQKKRRWRSAIQAAVLFVILFSAFVLASTFLRNQVDSSAQGRFQSKFSAAAERVSLETDLILDQYASTLFAARALYNASVFVDRSEWQTFSKSQDLSQRLPALKAIEYIERVSLAEKDEYVQSVKEDVAVLDEGYPDFDIFPDGDRDVYYPVHYIEPFETNEEAFGFDLFSNESRKAAIELARDSNDVVVTGPITLVQEQGKQKAFLMILPVYEHNTDTTTLAGRRAGITGLVLGVIRAGDLFSQIATLANLDERFSFSVSDITTGKDILLPGVSGMGVLSESVMTPEKGVTGQKRRVSVGTRIWEIGMQDNSSIQTSAIESVAPTFATLLGLVISLLVSLLVYNATRLKIRAESIAQDLTIDLSQTNRLFSLATQSANIGVWKWNLGTDVLEWSKEIYRIFGVQTSVAVRQEDVYTFIRKGDRSRVQKRLLTAIRESKEQQKDISVGVFDYQIVSKDGNKRHVRSAGVVVTDVGGEPTDVFGVSQDITNEKASEQQLRTSAEQASKAKERVDAIMNTIGDGVIVTDQDGKITLFNDTASKILGHLKNEAIGKPVVEMFVVCDKEGKPLPIYERPSVVALSSGQKVVTSVKDALSYKEHTSKAPIPVAITVAPFIENNKIIGSVLVFRDISVESEIDKAKTEFVSLASHQLRTPLSTIRWYVEMILDGDVGEISDSQRKYLQEIYEGNQRMAGLVNALLNVSRLELGTFVVEPELTNIQEMVKSVVKEIHPRFEMKHQKLDVVLDDEIPQMLVDPQLLRIVFQNLLSNAHKYTGEKGEISLTVKRAAKSSRAKKLTHLLIEVKDNGYGIPADQQDKIFSKLFRADNIKPLDTEGTGLGLYIIKSIVDHSGGTVSFTSKEDRGSTFSVLLPLSGMKKKEGSRALEHARKS